MERGGEEERLEIWGEGCVPVMGRRTWGKEVGRSVRTSLSKPSVKFTLSVTAFGAGIWFLWDAATCGSWPQGCQRGSRHRPVSPTWRRNDKPVKSREGSSGDVREAPVLRIQMKTTSVFQNKHDSRQPERGWRWLAWKNDSGTQRRKASALVQQGWRWRALLLWKPPPGKNLAEIRPALARGIFQGTWVWGKGD